MRVLHVVPGISPKFGSPSVLLGGLTQALSRRGVETAVFTTNADPHGRLNVPLGRPIDQDGMTISYFDVWPMSGYAFSLPLYNALRRAVSNYDVVHIHWFYNFSSLAGALVAQRAGVPFVVQVHGSFDPHLIRRHGAIKRVYTASVGRQIIGKASAVIFTSEDERQQAKMGYVRVPASYVVPVGLDASWYATLPPRGIFRGRFPEIGSRKLILFLGRICRQKGLDLLIPAFRLVLDKQHDAHLLIVGPDTEGLQKQVQDWVKSAGVESHVTFAPAVPHELARAAYVDSDVFVLSSWAENFGSTVTEALACRRPVVISERVNICDEIAKARAGIVVRCSPEAVADGICRVFDDPVLASQISENGYDLVQRKFTWDAVLDRLIAIYKAVQDGSSSGKARSYSF